MTKRLCSAGKSTQQKKTRNERKGAKDMNYMKTWKAKYSMNFSWTFIYKRLPAKYSASVKVQQNVGVAIGTVGQQVQSKGLKVVEETRIHVYSTD